MLLDDERHVIKWLSQYGALTKTQVIRLLRDKTPETAEKILRNLKREHQISDVAGGYYLALDGLCKPDQRTILAVWVLLRFIDYVDPMAHYPAVYPSQIFFLKENTGYEIVVLYDGEQHELMHGLHRGRFDLALVYDLELGHSVNKEMLNAPHKPYALLPASHPLAQKNSVTLQELSHEPMILLDAVPSKNYFITIFKEKGYHPEVAYSSPSIEMVRCMVGQGLGFSVLVTRPLCDMTYDGEKLVQLDIEDEMPASTLIMAHLANNEPTRPTQLFMDYCRSIELTPAHF